MTRTALDNALLLQVTAGSDGIDDRQVNCPPTSLLPAYHTALLSFPAKITPTHPKPLAGMVLGVLKEGFEVAGIDQAMILAIKITAARFEALGAQVLDVSIPEHKVLGPAVWHIISHMGCAKEVFEGTTNGRVGLQLTDLQRKMVGWDSPERFAEVSVARHSTRITSLSEISSRFLCGERVSILTENTSGNPILPSWARP